ncbi:MAG: hypothetical protein M1839_008929 [Geoglossum umbratile]|nr:MAG: hypothetical protein M1839_008929 [Geoglossum umbratile]
MLQETGIPKQSFISLFKLQVIIWTMIGVNTVFVIARTFARYTKLRKLQLEDIMMFLALAFFLSMAGVYLLVLPPLYRVIDVSAGTKPLYPAFFKDAYLIIKGFFATTMLFWATLWAVKVSLLLLFRRLMVGLTHYMRLWWALLAFTMITFVGCIVSEVLSCEHWFRIDIRGSCNSDRDEYAQKICLFYALAADLITDILIMALPMRLLWNLRISLAEKISVACIFGVGVICMIFATIRVISISEKAATGQASPTWLALWAVIEDSVAIIVGCLPSFAVVLRSFRPKRTTYGAYEFHKHPSSGSKPRTANSIKVTKSPAPSSFGTTAEGSASQEHLTPPAKGILVTSSHNITIEQV